MRKVYTGLGICLCAILILVLGIVVGAHLFLRTESGAHELIDAINGLIPGKISGRDIRLSLLDQSVSMRDVRLDGPDGQTIVRAKRLRLSMDLPALSKGDLRFNTIRLEQPQGTLTIDQEGRFNIEKAFVEKPSKKSALSVYIQTLTCRKGHLEFLGPDGKAWARLKQFDLDFSAVFAANTSMRFAIPRAQLTIFLGGRTIDCGMGAFSARLVNDRIQDILFTAQKNTSRMVVKGAVDNLAHKARLKGSADFDLDLAEFKQAIGIPGETRGRFSGTLGVSGDYDNPDLACDLAYGGGVLRGLSMGPIKLKGALHDRVFSCDELAYAMASGHILAHGAVDLKPVFPQGYTGRMDTDKVAYDLTVKADDLRLDEMPALPRDIDGKLNATMLIQGKGTETQRMDMRATFKAGATGFTVGRQLSKSVMTSEGRLEYRGGTLMLSSLTARMNAAMLTARGQVTLDSDKTIAGTMELRIPQLKGFLPPFTSEARGALVATAVLSGTFKVPQGELMLSGKDCAWRDIVLGAVDLDGRLDQSGVLTISRCRILNQASHIDATGQVRLLRELTRIDPNMDMFFAATLEDVTPRDFMPGLPVSGRLAGQITAAGNKRRLAGQITLTGEDIRYADMPLGVLDIRANLQDGVVTIRQAGLRRAGSALAITGTARVLKENPLAWMPDPAIDLRITEGRLKLEDFFPNAAGETTLTGSVQGTFKQPHGALGLAGRTLKLGPQQVEALDITARFEGDTLTLDQIGARIMPGQELKGSGWVNRQGGYALELKGQAIELAALDFLKSEDGLTGRMDLAFTGQGTIEHPRLSGHARIQGLKIKDQAFPDGTLSIELRDQRVDFEGMLPFAIRGWYDLARDAYQAVAVFERTDLTPFFNLYGKPGLSGEITGRLSAGGRGFALSGIDMLDADLKDLRIARGQRPLIQADTIKGSYSHRTLTVPKTHVRLARGGGFDISAAGTLEKDLVFTAQGDVPVAVLGALLQGMAGASGTVTFDAQAKTNASRSVMKALITLQDIGYPIDYNGQQIHGVNGTIRVNDNQVLIDRVTGQLDTGAFSVEGGAMLQGFTPSRMDLQLHAEKLPIVVPDTMDMSVDGDMTLKADRKRSSIEGDLALVEGTYYRDVEVNILTGLFTRILRKPQPVQHGGPMALSWPLTPMTELAVVVKRRGSVKVDNNLAELDLNPDLKITGTLADPIVNGRITVTQGTVTFQKNDFEVLRGAIDFVNPNRTEASVDIEGRTTIRDWTIDLDITGQPDELQVELSSTPAEEQADILSLLLVGKISREITQNQTGVRVSPSGMVAELIAGTYGEEIKKATTLDILKVESGDFTTAQSGENIKLTVGKTLTPRLSIQYEVQNSTTGAVQRGIAAYKLLDHVLVNGYQGNDGAYGADIQFQYDFR